MQSVAVSTFFESSTGDVPQGKRPVRRILAFTGDGKGKTTAAMGMVLRGVAQGMRVLVVQFVKGRRPSGEVDVVRSLGVRVERTGLGFVPPRDHAAWEKHRAAAREGLLLAAVGIGSGSWDLVVLDEVGAAIGHGLFESSEIVKLLEGVGEGKIAVVTGRGLPDDVLAVCDTVSRIECVKHAYQQGIPARAGVES